MRGVLSRHACAAMRHRQHTPMRSAAAFSKPSSFNFASARKMYTASTAFFEALSEAGISHCFVNLGSDHPSLIEAMVQRRSQLPRIITCPNEMVAMSMADGFARRSGRPQAVIVHVDVGTQGLGAAVHNASTGRAPVFIFAGLSPFTLDGEHRGSRTEYIHWIQDVPDQKAIVAQYCRYAGEVKSGHNVKQMVNRALQFAKSDPQGPVYLCGAREIMEADITPYTLTQEHWHPIQLAGIPDSEAAKIADALGKADRPLVITGYAGRNHQVPASLVKLANLVPGLQVLDSGGSDMCFPADHPAWLGLRYGVDQAVTKADVIVVIDCDTPWIPTRCRPRDDAVIYHIDVDPLKQQMPTFYIPALARYRADAKTAIDQIIARLPAQACESPQESPAGTRRRAEYAALLDKIESTAREETASGGFGTGHLCKTLKRLLPADSIYAVEAVTNAPIVMNNIRPTIPGSWINCGGGGLGWSGGGAMGIKLAAEEEGASGSKFIVQIVGDGTFLFSVPGSVYWIARRYNIPVLTIILNNKGWNAPRVSLELVHPTGLGSKATNEEINISFDPSPDYSGIAKAAAGGNLFAARVDKADALEAVLKEAIDTVAAGTSAVVDCKVA